MDILSLLVTSVGLAMDAFAVSVVSGVAEREMKAAHMLRIAAAFGVFQAAMPLLGWLGGVTLSSLIERWDHWIAFVLLGFIGGKMIYEVYKKPDGQKEHPFRGHEWGTLLAMSIATSIDALVTGVVLPTIIAANAAKACISACMLIGAVTFLLCLAGILIGKKCGAMFKRSASVLGGLCLIGIGVKILLESIL